MIIQRILSLLLIFLSLSTNGLAQNAEATYFEKASNGLVRFFYDSNYFLVDKNCEFKFLERVAGFNTSNNNFDGEFKDFDLNGRLLLSGSYIQGKKEGEFNAYYPNGKQKWQATFQNNRPIGTLLYYYPDGKPLLEILVHNDETYIKQYWNKFGDQKVKNGEGHLDITLPIKGFTEHGFTKYTTKGSVKDGLQQGMWYTSFVQDDRKRHETLFMVSVYENGILRNREVDELFENMLINFNTFSLIPNDLFTNAEHLNSKNCTFDEHSGFNSFIADKFTDFLKSTKLNTGNSGQTGLTYRIRVSKKGATYAPTLLETSRELSQKEKVLFTQMINQIPYYLPSYKDNKPIDDILNISLVVDKNGDNIHISPVQIKREKGI